MLDPNVRVAEVPENDEEILQKANELHRRKMRALNERVIELANGKAEAPNEVVGYLITRLNSTRREHEQVLQQIKTLTSQLQALQQRQINLEGEYNSRISDIQYWDRELTVVHPQKKIRKLPLGDPELETQQTP